MIEITTWSEFLSIADDGEYTLAKNITPDEGFDWTAYLPKSFSGIKIDGRGRAVGSKNNPIKAPLFENLTGAGIANLKVYADIDYTTLAGAVAVRAYAGEFANLTVNGKVASTASSGGLFGELNNNCEVRSCTNNAEVISVSNHSGGITAVSNNSKVYNCANTGAITGNDYAGGIASEAQTSAVLSCANSGTINVSVNGGYAGGIVAFIIGTDISDNINSGYVGSKQPLPGAAGGIVGYTTSLPCNITNNINTCRVKSTTMAGGIVGYGTANSNICTKNVNTGDVIGQTAGGLAGYLVTSEVGSVTDNRVCAKLIEADASNISRAGGLIGFSDPQDIPRSVERNYISIDKILGYDTTLAHYFIGSYDTPDPDAFPGNVYADNYYDANTNIEFSATPSDPSECDGATDPLILQLCGTLYTDAALPVGDKLAACMRGVWDETKHDCTFDEAEKLRRDAQDALISVIAGIASMENNLKDLLESAACILKRGIQSAEDVDDLTEINKVVMGLVQSATGVETALKKKLLVVTELLRDIIDSCNGCEGIGGGTGGGEALCCITLYFATDGTRLPIQEMQLEITDADGNPIDGSPFITDDTGKVLLKLKPCCTYYVRTFGEGEWADAEFTITTDDECGYTVGGATSDCCYGICTVTIFRPGFEPAPTPGNRPRCRAFVPFAPDCSTSGGGDSGSGCGGSDDDCAPCVF